MFRTEFCLVLVAVLLAFVFPNAGSRYFDWVETKLVPIARRRLLAVLLVGLTALVLRAALLRVLPVPEPVVDDEFSYLLAADTFAHGRLTTPTHPMWVHFEALQVIHQPTYMSKYPLAQGLVLAAGKVIAGNPFWGVWFSVGLMCAAICWALQGWFDERWALFGGLLAVARIGVFSYWNNSYWGGAVAATGGALVLGALPRLKRDQRARDAIVIGLGLAILANSRPYEGLVFSLPVAFALLVWILRQGRQALWRITKRVVLPMALVLAFAGGATGYYFWRVTGSPFRMPYQVFEQTYDPAPYFVWQSLKPLPSYRDQTLKDWELRTQLPQYMLTRVPIGFVIQFVIKGVLVWLFYLGPLFTLPLLMSIGIRPHLRDVQRQIRFLLPALAFWLVGMACEVQFFPHYAAPITALLLAIVLASMQGLSQWQWRGKPVGLSMVRSAAPLFVLLFMVRGAAGPLRMEEHGWGSWISSPSVAIGRDSFTHRLEQQPGSQLVLVRYGPDHVDSAWTKTHHQIDDWVYNGADIDGARVVWARDMGADANQELIRYYKDRTTWLLDADETPATLKPYESSSSEAQSAMAGR